MQITQRIRDRVLQNPAAWLFFGLFLLAEYWNYEKGTQIDALCEAIPVPAVIHFKPSSALEEAQFICDARREPAENSN